MKLFSQTFSSFILPALLILIWEMYTYIGNSPVYLPSFTSIILELWDLLSDFSYWSHIGNTIYRFLFGFLISALIAIPVGLLLGWQKYLYKYFEFIIEFFRPLPSASVIPIAILFLGIDDGMKVFVIVFGSFWPILINTIDGVRNIEPQYFKTAKVFKISKIKIIRHIILPTALPQIFSGLKISIAIALILAITVEMIVGGNGIGYFILDAERSFQFKEMYAGVITIGIIGYFINILINQIEKWVVYWR